MKVCQNCNGEFTPKDYRNKFCSSSCSISHSNKNRKLSEQTKKKISNTVSKSIKEKWKDPTYRNKIITSLKKRKNTYTHSEETKRK